MPTKKPAAAASSSSNSGVVGAVSSSGSRDSGSVAIGSTGDAARRGFELEENPEEDEGDIEDEEGTFRKSAVPLNL